MSDYYDWWKNWKGNGSLRLHLNQSWARAKYSICCPLRCSKLRKTSIVYLGLLQFHQVHKTSRYLPSTHCRCRAELVVKRWRELWVMNEQSPLRHLVSQKEFADLCNALIIHHAFSHLSIFLKGHSSYAALLPKFTLLACLLGRQPYASSMSDICALKTFHVIFLHP